MGGGPQPDHLRTQARAISVPILGTVVQGDNDRHIKLGDFTDLLPDEPGTVKAHRIHGDGFVALES